MPASIPPRRWFQFSLLEVLTLGPVLAIMWWQSAVRPVYFHYLENELVGAPPSVIGLLIRGCCGLLAIIAIRHVVLRYANGVLTPNNVAVAIVLTALFLIVVL
jgi:hypothetical protein